MATYTHHEIANSPFGHWEDVIGGSYTFNATTVTFTSSDGTKTKAFGSFLILNGNLIDGPIFSLQRTSANGATVYESITGLSMTFGQFTSVAVDDRLRLAFNGNDTLNGFSGSDYLDGGLGSNVMSGGGGDDYYIAGLGDIIENPMAGNDTVEVRDGDYELPDNVEDAVVLGTYTSVYGNALANEFDVSSSKGGIHGGNGTDTFIDSGQENTFYGGAHDDIYYLQGYSGVIFELEDEGNDVVYAYQDFWLPDNVETLQFMGPYSHTGGGNDGDNYLGGTIAQEFLYGLGGKDTLRSLGGNDVLFGGKDDDTYIIHDGDSVVEFADEGIDFVQAHVSIYKLPENVENLQFTGDTAYGNDIDNVITLNGGNYVSLYGLKGNDTFNASGPAVLNIDGGEGDDAVVYKGNFAGWQTIVDYGDGNGISFQSLNTFHGAVGVEHFQFKDGTIHVNDGNPLFDTMYYMQNNPDVYHSGMNAIDHYNAIGWKEGRDPNAFFDTSGYLAANPDVAAAGMNPLTHYQLVGWKEGRDPSAEFDTTRYLLKNPDVAASGMNPLEHYLQVGRASYAFVHPAVGKNITNGFDAEWYLFHNPDVAAAGVDPLFHYNNWGWKEGRDPNAWFDSDGYLAYYTDVDAAGINPFDHYMATGWKEGRDASAGFDTAGYLAAYPDVAAAGMNPLDHFLQFGIYEGRHAVNDGMWG